MIYQPVWVCDVARSARSLVDFENCHSPLTGLDPASARYMYNVSVACEVVPGLAGFTDIKP